MTNSPLIETMVRSTPWIDRLAIGGSILCLVHCLVTPLMLVMLPGLGASLLAGETLHLWLVYAVIPSSLYALGLGCKQHQRLLFMFIGLAGLGLLVLGVLVEAIGLDHMWEPILTVSGTLLVALAHVRNFQLCRKSRTCNCR